jgi:hypothetical protein
MGDMNDVLLEGCPTPYLVDPAAGTVLCGCSDGGPDGPRHAVYRGTGPLFCRCAPREIPRGSGVWQDWNTDGYACPACADRLPSWAVSRRLVADWWCCYCGNPTDSGVGYRLHSHPAPER